MKQIILLAIVALFAFGCQSNNTQKSDSDNNQSDLLQRFEIIGEAQGTYYRVVYYHTQDIILQDVTDSLLQAFDQSASNYTPNSIISKVNRSEAVELDKSFIEIFELANQISIETNGLFDITVRPLVELYGFGKSNEVRITDSKRDSVMQFVGYQKVRIEQGQIIKEDQRLQLDFNAIAQGYSVDYVLDYLHSEGIEAGLVDIGGEVRAFGMKPENKSWTVAIEDPNEGAEYGQSIQAILRLDSFAMATSGNYRKFVEKDGKKYVHTLDPLTGKSVQSKLLSASILAPTAAEADAYATACMVMGLEKSIEFVNKNPRLEAYFIYVNEEEEFANYSTDNMKKRLIEN